MPARTKLIADAYDYSRIAPIVDRMVIMAYDEHWSTSSPGPVASLPWCARVVDYARSAVESDKIVMGLPLYGRAWQDKRLAKALRFENVQDLVAETQSAVRYAPELGASFEYSENVVVTVFYDDLRSIMEKLRLYRARDISAVSFWRIGQGPRSCGAALRLPHGLRSSPAHPSGQHADRGQRVDEGTLVDALDLDLLSGPVRDFQEARAVGKGRDPLSSVPPDLQGAGTHREGRTRAHHRLDTFRQAPAIG